MEKSWNVFNGKCKASMISFTLMQKGTTYFCSVSECEYEWIEMYGNFMRFCLFMLEMIFLGVQISQEASFRHEFQHCVFRTALIDNFLITQQKSRKSLLISNVLNFQSKNSISSIRISPQFRTSTTLFKHYFYYSHSQLFT